jgi:hypothetical protein
MANRDDVFDIEKYVLESANEAFPLSKRFNASVDFPNHEVPFVMACVDLIANKKGAVVSDVEPGIGLFSVRYSYPSAGWI